MHNYFCGWYYRCQSDTQTLAVIPSFHKTGEGNFCMIQVVTDEGVQSVPFPYSAFGRRGDLVTVGENSFSPAGIRLDLQTPEVSVTGSLHFGQYTPLRYDIMGPFRYMPFMECRHSVFSMRHTVDGTVTVNGAPYIFRGGVGYSEGDRGSSFPREYVWTQCSFPEGALMLSVAEIPLGKIRFTGIIGVVLWQGREYRIATYLGARAEKIGGGEVTVRQGKLRLTVLRLGEEGHPLQAPVQGAMRRTIHEHPACPVYYRFRVGDDTLLEREVPNAAMEFEYGEVPGDKKR